MKLRPIMSDTRSIYGRFAEKKSFSLLMLLSAFLFFGNSCGLVHNLFGPKYGCPSDGKNVGAERILSGEKVPKASKFKS
jgi:hypothetical protein